MEKHDQVFLKPHTACSHLPGSVGDHPHADSSPHIVVLEWSCHFTCKDVLKTLLWIRTRSDVCQSPLLDHFTMLWNPAPEHKWYVFFELFYTHDFWQVARNIFSGLCGRFHFITRHCDLSYPFLVGMCLCMA